MLVDIVPLLDYRWLYIYIDVFLLILRRLQIYLLRQRMELFQQIFATVTLARKKRSPVRAEVCHVMHLCLQQSRQCGLWSSSLQFKGSGSITGEVSVTNLLHPV
jgi:3-hydroxymyristoyl/3-hydroxydecanoyl-(acyl carrier protein) dehydratase